MRKKHPVPLTQKFPNADPLAVQLLGRLLAFDPKDRPSAEEVNMRVFSSTFVLTISRTHVS
jgi:serine/threonine protein kinase